jgi:acetyltransferase-like isoleucine patch superfamily enzyme
MLLFSKILYLYSKLLKKLRGVAILNSEIGNDSKVESGSNIINSEILGHSYIGYDSTVLNAKIGSFCSISNRVIIGGTGHPVHFVSTSPVFLSHKDSVKVKYAHFDYLPQLTTNISHDVWIGESVLIKAGVTIGIGAVIGMGSVVTKNVPPYAIYAGNPAKLIRYRFDKDTINRLLILKWWEFCSEKLVKMGCYINKPEIFLEKVEGGQV